MASERNGQSHRALAIAAVIGLILAGGIGTCVQVLNGPTSYGPNPQQGGEPQATPSPSDCQYAANPISTGSSGDVFVVCQATGNIAVISPSNDSVVSLIQIGAGLWGASGVYDTAKQEIFLSDTNNGAGDSVSVISVTTDAVVSTINIGSNPGPSLYDSGAGEVFVTAAAGVVVISDASNTVVATIHAGYGADGLAYDPATDVVFVAYSLSDFVAAVSDRSNSVVATIPVGASPGQMAYGDGRLFVTNQRSNNVTVVDTSDYQTASSVSVGTDPAYIVFDSGKSEFFVSNFYSATVSVMTSSGLAVATVQTFPYPTAMTYVASSGTIYLQNLPGLGPNAGGYNLTVISDVNNQVSDIIPVEDRVYGVAYDPGLNELFVPTLSASPVSPCGYAYAYAVNVISTVTNTTITSIPVGRSAAFYCVTFTESGFNFADGAVWCVVGTVLPGLTECSTVAVAQLNTLPNGTYTYTVSDQVQGQSPVIPSGTITVHGGPVFLNVTFVSASPVTFTAAGLPNGASWAVTINGTVTLANGSQAGPFLLSAVSSQGSSQLVVSLPNGSYSFSASSSGFELVQGSVTLAKLGPVLIPVTFESSSEQPFLGLPIAIWTLLVAAVIGGTTAVVVARGSRGRIRRGR